MPPIIINGLERVPEYGQVITTLRDKLRSDDHAGKSAPAHACAAQVIPFANAALKHRMARLEAQSTSTHAGNTALDAVLSDLEQAKDQGPGQEELQLLNCLLDALSNDSFQVYFQTQHCLRTNAIVGAEALLRLSDDNGRLHNTQTLIDLAEEYGLIGLIGHQMMRKACTDFAQLRREGHIQGRLALNVSPLELRHAGYAEALLQAVHDSGLAPTDIELEITETQSLDLPGLKLKQLVELAATGVELAVDDFGTGYASWSTVTRLPFSSVKLDRGLVAPVMECTRTQQLIAHLVRCGNDMGYSVVAEGIQGVEQQALLVELGCEVGQGFGLSVPMSAAALRGESTTAY